MKANNERVSQAIGINSGGMGDGAPECSCFKAKPKTTYDEWLEFTPRKKSTIFSFNIFNTQFHDERAIFSMTLRVVRLMADRRLMRWIATLRDEFLGLDIIAC